MNDDAATRGLTSLLADLNGDDPNAFARLVDEVYTDLKQIAGRRLAERFARRGGAGLTLGPTAIADDAVMELRRQRAAFQNSGQFFAIATRLIERLLSAYHKHRNAKKRGGGNRGAALDHDVDAAVAPSDPSAGHAVEALKRLHEEYPRKAEVVTLHVMCGHSLNEVAQMIGVDKSTTERDWAFARRWLARELEKEERA